MLEDRVGRHEVTETEVTLEGGGVERAVPDRALSERFDLAGKMEDATQFGIEEGFFAQAIPRQEKLAPALVVDGEGEHPLQILRALRPVFLVGMHDRLRVATSPESVPSVLELTTQLVMVVDLAVEDHPTAAILVRHRLLSGRAVDDGQSPMPQRRALELMGALAVGPR